MGLSHSRSVKFGALRFNFSGMGIGVSAGIPGFRIGTGPRGAYISAGVGGFRYRQSLGAGRNLPHSNTVLPTRSRNPHPTVPIDGNIIHTEEHLSVDVMALSDASGDQLLQSMNEQAKKTELWPIFGGVSIIGFLALRGPMAALPEWIQFILLIFLTGGTLWLRQLDRLKKLTVLFYEPDHAVMIQFTAVVSGASSAAAIRKIRSILATSRYADIKYSAGALRGLKLEKASFYIGQARGIVANVDVPIITSGKTTLAFYPDRVLAFQPCAVGAVEYHDLDAIVRISKFVEKEGAPSDATVVDRTWQYVNKKGGPDKRFKSNREYPVCLYEELRLSSSRGLDIRVMGSKSDGFDAFVSAIQRMRGGLTAALVVQQA